jgi:hypothetical protein
MHHFLTFGSQLAKAVSLEKSQIRSIIHAGLRMKTGTVTAIMTDVKRLISPRRWCQLMLHRSRISPIIADRQKSVLAYFIVGWLCVKY